MGKPLGLAFNYSVAFSLNNEIDYVPADKPHEPIIMEFDSDYFESDEGKDFVQRL